MPDILDDLTDAQKQAVSHINGPLLVIAGPGSGKTRVITRRIAYLLYCGIRPWNILAITFTNKAAAEMRRRVESLVTEKGVWLSTFHAYCARVLREFAPRLGFGKDFTIYDASDSIRLIQQIMKEKEIPTDNVKPRAVQSIISVAKGDFRTPDEFAAEATDFMSRTAAGVYTAYQEALRSANAMDFDDLLMKTAQLLRDDAETLEKLRQRHQFILVDEFQDTSRSQYMIVGLLAASHRNICVTGDPDQSIYGWRGADISNILEFESDYPEAKVVYLDLNYRSTRTILDAANGLVSKNELRKERTLSTDNPVGDKIRMSFCEDNRDEAAQITRTVRELLDQGTAAREIAIFYRVNALSRGIEEKFIESGLPYQIIGGTEFYGRREVKDILAYLRVAVNPSDETSLLRVINAPPRGLGPKAVETILTFAKETKTTAFESLASQQVLDQLPPRGAAGARALHALVSSIARVATGNAADRVRMAVSRSGYTDALKSTGRGEDKDRVANLDELINAAVLFDQESPDAALAGFLEQSALASDIDTWHDKDDRVNLMTMHAAKGLEFDAVLIAGLDEGILPHSASAHTQAQLEEERRIFFVAMTRARKQLFLYHSESRLLNGTWFNNNPSRFLREIPPLLIEEQGAPHAFAPAGHPSAPFRAARPPRTSVSFVPEGRPGVPAVGTRVRHMEFGAGTIRSVAPQGQWHKMTVQFPIYGEKKLIFEKARLEIL